MKTDRFQTKLYTMKLRYTVLIQILVLAFIWAPFTTAQSVLPENFDQFVEQGLNQWDIPGIGIAIVKDGEVILAQGYGVLKLGEERPVNEHTQFGVASVSKHITASSLAVLVDEGLLNWNDPVQKHIPWFKLSDPWVTENVTIRDLLTHQVGVGRMLGNRLQFMTNNSRSELLYRMRYHDFEQPFRSDYVYSNVMYTLAGEVVAAVTGISWDDFVMQRFFNELGMNRSNTSITDLHSDGNAAWPHQYIEGEVIPINRRNWDVASPAGGVNSTPTDMATWMLLQLGVAGTFNGNELISERSMRDIQTPKVSRPIASSTSEMSAYGFGFNITDYEGYRLLSHGGATDGMNTSYVLMPDLDFGIIVMTNVFTSFREAIVYTVIDHMLGIEDKNWNERYYQNYVNRYNQVKQLREEFESARATGTNPTHSLSDYAGKYENDLYGETSLTVVDGSLKLSLWDDTITGTLEHWHHNTFRIIWDNKAKREEFVSFQLNIGGEIEEKIIRFSLRPLMLQVGAYPSNYYRDVRYIKTDS